MYIINFVYIWKKLVIISIPIIIVPTPEINLNTSDVYYVAGSSLVLTCELVLMSENIDNDTVAIFKLKNNIDDVVMSDTSSPEVTNGSNLIYTAYFCFDDLNISDAGEYTCTGIIDDAMNSSFIIQSNEIVDSKSVFIKSKWIFELANY